MSTLKEIPPLPQGVAYGIVLGFGIIFAAFMNIVTWIARRYLQEPSDTQMMMTARKSVKTGLIASAVVSSWCYAATILNSVRLTYVYGFAGLWWFVTGATCQIVCYSIMAIELKRRAPRANTILEAIRVRFGTSSHLVFFAYGVAVQVMVTAALLLGGSAAMTATTGASTAAMNYLIPLGVVVYTYLGGLKSTFISDYLHTTLIFIVLLVTMFKVFTSSPVLVLGSPGKLHDLLVPMATQLPAVGAKDGSYLTMRSDEGLLLAGVILVSGFGSVFVDPSYGQKAIAGEASAVVKGYLLGAFAWFAIPLGLCATMSFAAVALQDTKYWPVSGGVTPYQIDNALILPLAAQAIMGTGGVVAVVLMVFMAVTSSFSAELVGHASIVTYDIYPYINPRPTEKQLKTVSHLSLIGFAIFSASFATALDHSGISMGWILEFIGVFTGSAVIPIALAISSSHVTPRFVTYAPPIGTAFALATWLGVAKSKFGAITVITTFENWSMFSGCFVGLMLPLVAWCCMRPFSSKPYDWENLFLMISLEPRLGDRSYTREDDESLGPDWNPNELARAAKMAKIVSGVLCLIFLVIIPLPLYGTGYIMSRGFFTAWTVVVFMWSFIATLSIMVLPIWQSRKNLYMILRNMTDRSPNRPRTPKRGSVTETIDLAIVGADERASSKRGSSKSVMRPDTLEIDQSRCQSRCDY